MEALFFPICPVRPDIIRILWISTFRGHYLHFMDISVFCRYNMHIVDIVDISTPCGYYLYWSHYKLISLYCTYYLSHSLILCNWLVHMYRLEHFSVLQYLSPFSAYYNFSCHYLVHSLLYDDRKQDAATAYEHSKLIIELFKRRKLFFSDLSEIWENIDSFADQYRCAIAVHLLSMLEHEYNIITDHGVGSTWHGRGYFRPWHQHQKFSIDFISKCVSSW